MNARTVAIWVSPLALGYIAAVPSDEDLMAAYIAGDRAAFRELFQRYAPLLQRAMARDLRSAEEANDLVQQTFLHLHRSRLDFEPGRKLKPWVFTIALNLKREFFRRSKRRHETSLDDDGAAEPFEGPRGQQRSDAARETTRALSALPAEHREVIELHWFGGLSFPEIAEAVGSTVSAVKVRAHRGYVALRARLGDDLPDPSAGLAEGKPSVGANR
jgi:RNA polymerase sigma-70 factor (ECF subfamily)